MENRPPRRTTGILSELDDFEARRKPTHRSINVAFGTRVQHRPTGTYGRVLRILDNVVILEDMHGRERGVSRVPGGFAIDGETVTIVGIAPSTSKAGSTGAARTASGSVAAPQGPAKVAQASRIWVEGDHDARLVERIWGDDLRDLAIVVEPLGGIDNLAADVADFSPGPRRKLGVLVDHLVPGSKETRIVEQVNHPDVMIVGHRYVDIWQCIRPKVLGIAAWPEVPKNEEWKMGVCRRLGWGTPQDGWAKVLASVSSFADVEPDLVGGVERLLDFLTVDAD